MHSIDFFLAQVASHWGWKKQDLIPSLCLSVMQTPAPRYGTTVQTGMLSKVMCAISISINMGQLTVFQEALLASRFRHFWARRNTEFARNFFERWCKQALETGLPEIHKAARMLKRHLENILTSFVCYITHTASEGLNSKIQAIKANARGFRTFENYRVSSLFFCGKLDLSP